MLNASFLALSDPTRRAIMARLALGEASVNEISQPFAISQPAISQHLKVLENAGLILRRVDGTRRPCRLAPQALSEMDQWIAALRRTMEQNYARLDALLAEETRGKETP
jgi:DNA-binding transcriptional ArsR family regulator